MALEYVDSEKLRYHIPFSCLAKDYFFFVHYSYSLNETFQKASL